jgi:hypothetical protein
MTPAERLKAAEVQLDLAEKILAELWSDRDKLFEAARLVASAEKNVTAALKALSNGSATR